MRVYDAVKRGGRWIVSKGSAAAGTALVTVGTAFAEVPANVETAIGDAGTDAAKVAGLVFIAVIGLLAFKLMRRAGH